MAAGSDFSSRLDEAFTEHKKQISSFHEQSDAESKQLEARFKKFQELRTKVGDGIAKPRLEMLAKKFPDMKSRLEKRWDGGVLHLSFPKTDERPAMVELELSVSHDDTVQNVIYGYHLRIIPAFMKFNPESRLEQPLEKFDEKAVAKWLDDCLVEFTKTYLSIETVEWYQRANLVTDPVLNSRFPKSMAAGTVEHGETTYYFASEDSLKRFKAKPEMYLSSEQPVEMAGAKR